MKYNIASDVLFESVPSKNYGKIEYSKERLKELEKKKYVSNGYYWVYVGGSNYAEMPLHNYVWNLYHPDERVNIHDKNIIHHKDENKFNNSPSNLERKSIVDHNHDHLTQRRKDMPNKFNSKSSSLGGKAAQAKRKLDNKK